MLEVKSMKTYLPALDATEPIWVGCYIAAVLFGLVCAGFLVWRSRRRS